MKTYGKHKKPMLCLFVTLLLGFNATIYANINGSLGNFFSSLGYVGNSTASHADEKEHANE